MVKLFAYVPERDTFVDLTRPVAMAPTYEYEVYFCIFSSDHSESGMHYIYCKCFNDLVVVIGKLKSILNNPNTRSHYTHLEHPIE